MLWLGVRLIDAKTRIVQATRKFLTGKEEGATAVEYGLLVALIAAVIVGTVVLLGGKVKSGFVTIEQAMP